MAPATHIPAGALHLAVALDVADQVVPLLQERGVFRADYTGSTIRGLAPLGRPDETARQDERAARAAA